MLFIIYVNTNISYSAQKIFLEDCHQELFQLPYQRRLRYVAEILANGHFLLFLLQ